MSPEVVVSELPHLPLADVSAALASYHDHREAINTEIAADRAWYEDRKARQTSRLRGILDTSTNPPVTMTHENRHLPRSRA
jgi:hypothetical protein